GFKGYAISLGYFQDLDTEIHYDKCKDAGILVGRRSGVGGGTIFVDRSSMAMAMVADENKEVVKKAFPDMDTAFHKLGAVIKNAYEILGVKDPWYKHIGDIKIGKGSNERKITGFGFVNFGNLLICNCILSIGEMDIDKFIDCANIPPEKIKDKNFTQIADYLKGGITSIERETGYCPTFEEVKDAFYDSFKNELNFDFEMHKRTEKDIKRIEKSIARDERKHGETFLFEFSSKKKFADIPKEWKVNFGRYKSRKLLVAHLVTNQEIIEDVMFSGDFYCKPTAYLFELERSLKGLNYKDHKSIEKKIKEIFNREDWEMPEVNPEDFIEVIKTTTK
ncbi:MAG: lipoate--protein ligase family protein, partial [Candidatus Helarchaeota archaeon]|nr:lipoate--protein ligase family protein [Candidatus Helarchaeota archaeon]